MNEKLSAFLIELRKPEIRRAYLSDPDKFLSSTDLSEVDRVAILSGNPGILKYQTRFGDLTIERIRNADYRGMSLDHEHVHIGPEHEHDFSSAPTDEIKRTFGPNTRQIGANQPSNAGQTSDQKKANSLVVIGTGIKIGHLTDEAKEFVAWADALLYCVADAPTELELKKLNADAEDLSKFYGNGKLRHETYSEMANRILAVLREGRNVCAAFYGHPGLFVRPAHTAVEKARSEGYEASMCPAPSSVDCLIADLGVDLSWDGCQIFEATQFLLRNRRPDTEVGLILLQIGSVGDPSFNSKGFDGRHFPLLVSRLIDYYGPDYTAVLYEAAQFPICTPRIDLITLKELTFANVTSISTMYLPPTARTAMDANLVDYLRENVPQYRGAPTI